MRYPASETLEIIRTVEASHLPVKRTLAMLGVAESPSCKMFGLSVRASSMTAERREEGSMTPPRSEGCVRMPDAEFEAILTRAAEE